MKHQWLAYAVVAVISIGAGVAIAGLPDNTPANATITPTTIAGASDTTTPETAPADTTAPTTAVETTTPETTQPAATTPPTTAPETTVPTTTEPDTGGSVPADLPDRSELSVIAANGSNVAGAAARLAATLEEIGYVDVQLRNGTTFFEFTTVYYSAGFEESALRLAEDLDLLPDFVAPIEDAPNVTDLPDEFDLLVYIGLDRS